MIIANEEAGEITISGNGLEVFNDYVNISRVLLKFLTKEGLSVEVSRQIITGLARRGLDDHPGEVTILPPGFEARLEKTISKLMEKKDDGA